MVGRCSNNTSRAIAFDAECVFIIIVIAIEFSVRTKLLMEILNRLLLFIVLSRQVVSLLRKLDESLTEILVCLQDSV